MFVKKTFDSIVKRPLCYTLAGFLTAYFTFGFLRGSFKLYIAISFDEFTFETSKIKSLSCNFRSINHTQCILYTILFMYESQK